MNDPNKHNLLFFEAESMKALFSEMEQWQLENQKRLQSVSIEKDSSKYCCIALSNPTECIIVNGRNKYEAYVDEYGSLYTKPGR